MYIPHYIYTLIPDPEILLAFEPEELAGIILQFLNSMPEGQHGDLNRYNFSLKHTVKDYPPEFHDKILNALMEGWSWLQNEGLIVHQPGADGDWFIISRRGQMMKKKEDLDTYRRASLLPKRLLHPLIEQRVWSAILRGEYDTAVFLAFKEVEIAVREAGDFQPNDLGVDLMRKAFHKTSGPLTKMDTPESERDGLSHLFAGAIGSYKNPQSHRNVAITDPTEAFEMILLASHLFRIVDSRRKPFVPSP